MQYLLIIRARQRLTGTVLMTLVDRHEDKISATCSRDLIGPMRDGQYKYTLVLTDVRSRYVTAFELTALTARNVDDKLSIHCSYSGLPSISHLIVVHISRASWLISACLERLGVSPRFHCPYKPCAARLVERSNATIKQIISKLIADLPSSWHKPLPFSLWSIRACVIQTLRISPYQVVFSQIAIGSLQLLSDHWTGCH